MKTTLLALYVAATTLLICSYGVIAGVEKSYPPQVIAQTSNVKIFVPANVKIASGLGPVNATNDWWSLEITSEKGECINWTVSQGPKGNVQINCVLPITDDRSK